MGRKSKLTPEQWAEVDRRLIAGERPSDLAREFGVAPSAMTRRGISQNIENVQRVAKKLANAQTELATLPIAQQYQALTLADELRGISTNLAAAARLGAQTAHRLQALANSEVAKVDDAAPMASIENLRNVGVLTKLANDSAATGLNLLAANKELAQRLNGDDGDEGDSDDDARTEALARRLEDAPTRKTG